MLYVRLERAGIGMTIFVVLYAEFDDWDLIGASTDKEKAKDLKRNAPHYIEHITIVECEDGKPWRES